VPITLSLLEKEWPELFKGNLSSDALAVPDISEMLASRLIKPTSYEDWLPLESWSRISTAYPHVLFDYSPSGTESFDGGLDEMFKSASYFVVRDWKATSKTLRVWTQQKLSLISFEYGDILKESIDPPVEGSTAQTAAPIIPDSKEHGNTESNGTKTTPGSPTTPGSEESASHAVPGLSYTKVTVVDEKAKLDPITKVGVTKELGVTIKQESIDTSKDQKVRGPLLGAPEVVETTSENSDSPEVETDDKKKKKYKKIGEDGKEEFMMIAEGDEVPAGYVPA